jgi:RNA polymerase sigma factor (sigma-70 family)
MLLFHQHLESGDDKAAPSGEAVVIDMGQGEGVDEPTSAVLGAPLDNPAPLDSSLENELLTAGVVDAVAFGAFYRATVPEVTRYFARRVFDPELVADLTAETYAQLLQHAHRFDPSRGSARQFLFGIVRIHLLRWQQRGRVSETNRRRVGITIVTGTADAFVEAESRLDAGRLSGPLSAAFAALGPGERAAVTLRVLGQQSYAEVGAALGCNPGTARVRVSRGLANLARHLERHGVTP